ncbi:MAG: hypothetical protein AAGE43_13155 [Pseudomonadota bacterium]
MPDKPDAEQPDWIEDLYAEGADEQPPAAIDATIREAARSHGVTPWYRDPRHLTGLAAAASFVLVVLIGFYGPEPDMSAPEVMPSEVAMPTVDGQILSSPDEEAVLGAGEREAALEPLSFSEGLAYERLPAASVDATQNLAESPSLEEAAPAARQELARKRETPTPASRGASAATAPAATAAPRDLPSSAKARSPETVTYTADVAAAATAVDEAEDANEADAVASPEQGQDGALSLATALPATDLPLSATDTADLEARLQEACGPLPGTPDNRRWEEDGDGLYLVLEAADGASYFRCGQDPASPAVESSWYEIPRPDPLPSEQ